jgi:hypothetical protein
MRIDVPLLTCPITAAVTDGVARIAIGVLFGVRTITVRPAAAAPRVVARAAVRFAVVGGFARVLVRDDVRPVGVERVDARLMVVVGAVGGTVGASWADVGGAAKARTADATATAETAETIDLANRLPWGKCRVDMPAPVR